jgi:hypothetical protein
MSVEHWFSWQPPSPDATTQVKAGHDLEYGWVHYLIANRNEGDPDNNHIHIKHKSGSNSMRDWVVCAIRVDGMREVSRRELIDKVNGITGLDLEYR